MKPCRTNRKLIAWLTLDVLEDAQQRKLRAHLETCSGCRSYLAELSAVSQAIKAADATAHNQGLESFHRRVLGALRAQESGANWPALPLQRLLNWRVALPAFCGIALLVFALSNFFPRPGHYFLPGTTAQFVTPVQDRRIDLPPTLSTYELVANQSLEKLDELLSRQASRNPPPAPNYRASSLLPDSATE
jgi:hypothetical protein